MRFGKTLATMVCVGASMLGLGGEVEATPVLPKPIAHWELDDNAPSRVVKDSAGTYDGVATTDTQNLSSSEGIIGNCFDFSGNSSYVNFGNVLGIDNPLSISLWFNADSIGYSNHLLTKLGANQGKTTYEFTLLDSQGIDTLQTSCFSDIDTPVIIKSPINLNQWYHAVMTRDDSNFSLYVDGELFDSIPYSGTAVIDNQPLTLAIRSDGNFSYSGLVDDIRFYDETLDAGQVQALYDGEFWEGPVPEPAGLGLVSLACLGLRKKRR